MTDELPYKTLKEYYRNFEPYSPTKTQILMICTLGLYLISWVYQKNKEFEEFYDDSPDSNRGAVLMLVFPFAWLLIIWVFKAVIFVDSIEFLTTLSVIGWIFIMFMILEYLYEFCLAYGQFTRTNGLVWYYTIFPGFLALILVVLGFWYTLPLLFFPYMTIPAMQAKLNYESTRYGLNYLKNEFYRHERKYSS